ncbi:MAG: protein kinase [Myxococcales bacterium]|nr:protein kinase [Myxococcales bacterium]
MEHPSIASLLDHARGAATSPALAAHLAACAACRGLAGVGDPFGARALVELIEVDPALYSQREPLRAAHSGMGRAFRAWDRRIGRAVVIKQIGEVPDVPVAALRARFEREARITARLQHPGIVAVLELGRWPDGEPFYAMPLVEGEPLDEAIARTTTAAQRLALLPRVAAAAEAVAYAHDRGVVHRDLKPANILLGRFGETVVIDWGLAAPLDEPGDLPLAPVDDDGLTRAGVGTAAYMPPEQAAGAPPDPRFDVYALGATLYHALAGTPPYGADLGAAARARLAAGAPPPLTTRAPDAPPALVAIVERAMAPRPAERFPTALALAEELRRFTTGQLILSHRYRPGERLRHWLRHHRAATRVAAAALVVVAAIGAAAVARVVDERDRARAARARAEASERTTRTALAAAQLAHARGLAARPIDRLEALTLAAEARTGGAAATAAGWQALIDTLAAGPVARALPDATRDVAFAPVGATLATLEADGRVTLRDDAGRARGALTSRLTQPLRLSWSPDGARLVVIGLAGQLGVIDPARAVEQVVTVAGGDGEALPAFLADGSLIVASGARVERWDASGTTRQAAATLPCRAYTLAAAARLVVVGCADGALVAWDGAAPPRGWPAHGGEAAVTAAPDRAIIYSSGDDGRALAWPADALAAALAGGAPPAPRVLLTVDRRIYLPIPWPDGRTLSVGHGAISVLDLATGAATADVARSPELRAIPGARRLFGHEGGADVIAWDVASREAIVRLRGHRRFGAAAMAGAPDGARVATATSSAEAWLWDARLGRDVGALPGHDGEVVGLAAEGDQAVTASLDGVVRGVGLADGAVRRSTQGDAEIAAAVALADGGLATGRADGTVERWRPDGSLARRYPLSPAPIAALALDADGQLAITSADGTTRRLDLATGRATAAAPPTGLTARAADGARLEASPDGAVRAVDAGGEVRPLTPAGAPVIALALAPDGAHAAVSTTDGLRVWAVATGAAWTIPLGADGAATSLAFTDDGAGLLSGHASGAVRVTPVTRASADAQLCARLRGWTDAAPGCPALTAAPAAPSR